MLVKRTNILFDERLWKQLVALAGKEDSSVGALVRQAVVAHYRLSSDLAAIGEACAVIESSRPAQAAKIDYKKLINHGRKY